MGQVDPSKPHLFRRHKLSKAMIPVRVWQVLPNTSVTHHRGGQDREYSCGWIQVATKHQGGTHIESQDHACGTRKIPPWSPRDIEEYLSHHPRLKGGGLRTSLSMLGLGAKSAHHLITGPEQVVVLMTLKLKPILMRTEIGGTQPSIISSLSEAPPLAYFVHNTYLDPSVFGDMWFKCRRGTQFSTCGLNVFRCGTSVADFRKI